MCEVAANSLRTCCESVVNSLRRFSDDRAKALRNACGGVVNMVLLWGFAMIARRACGRFVKVL